MSTPGRVSLLNCNPIAEVSDSIDEFPIAIRAIAEQHRPSRMPFFRNLAALDHAVASDPAFLGQIHLIYQSAMHATRTAVYYLPHLDSPSLRKRKLQIFVDDDGLPGGDTHHYQLTRAFRNIGAQCVLEDEEFGDPEELCHHLDGETARFVRLAQILYSQSLGPWWQIVLKARPALLSETLSNAKLMAEALDGVWTHLDRFVQNVSRMVEQA
jgi:hypothetical protein